MVDGWFTELTSTTRPVRFRSYASPGQEDYPLVVVKLESESPQQDFLGHALGEHLEGSPSIHRGRYTVGNVVTQEVDIYCGTTSHELTRALYTVMRAMMHRLVPTLLGAGYVDVRFVSAQELMPDERLIAEEAGVFVRHMRWRASAGIIAYPLEEGAIADPDTWYVNVADLANGRVSGIE